MEPKTERDPRADFMAVYSDTIKRDGAASMLYWLDSNGFFKAPASSKYHLAQPGGLAVHSLNVYKRLLEITARDVFGAPDVSMLAEWVRETVAILGLLHDVCKVGVYRWAEGGGYEFRDPFPLGHGEKSLFLITRHMALTEAEALAIRWHMGAYDDAVKGGSRSMNEAMKLTPWVWRLQEADMCASWIDERSAAE